MKRKRKPISNKKPKHGRKRPGRPRFVDGLTKAELRKWAALDWTQTNIAIASTMNVAPHVVRIMREHLGKKPRPRGRPRGSGVNDSQPLSWDRTRKKWASVDWDQTNRQIAEKLGMSYERVRQVRLAMGKEKVRRKFGIDIAREWLEQNDERASRMTVSQAANEAGVSEHMMRTASKRLGRKRFAVPLTAAWRVMPINWELSSTDIEEIWNLPLSSISNARHRGEIRPARWHRRSDRNNPEYRKAITREKQKARRYAQRRKKSARGRKKK